MDWTGAPILASGTIPVARDGTYTTPSTPIMSLGCYTFTEDLPPTTAGLGASQLGCHFGPRGERNVGLGARRAGCTTWIDV